MTKLTFYVGTLLLSLVVYNGGLFLHRKAHTHYTGTLPLLLGKSKKASLFKVSFRYERFGDFLVKSIVVAIHGGI